MSDQNSPQAPAGWNELIEVLQALPGRMLEKVPEELRDDPQVQQEIGRLALAAVASCSIDAVGSDPDFPVFLPSINQVLNVGQPNADTLYRSAKISAQGTYRLRGYRGSLNQVMIGQVVPRNAETGSGRTYLDVNALSVDEQGRFDVLISATRPEGYEGDWWELGAHANSLALRMVSYDWAGEEPPTFSIERLDRPMGKGRPSAAALEQKLRTLPHAIGFLGPMFVDHVDQLRQQGFVHKAKEFDVSQIGGLTGQFYYEVVFDLTEDDALIIETEIPEICPYRSMILTNEIYETIDWYNNHSSLNGAQSQPDGDGRWRVVVSLKDPGVKNWLDPAGNRTGIVQGRWTNCDSQPMPKVRKVAFAEVAKHLPSDTAMITPQERDLIIRERRLALQQRPHW